MNGGSLTMISTAGQAFYDIGGNININGGVITMTAGQGLILNSSQTYTQTSGTFTTNGRIEFSNAGGASTVNVSGGLLTTSAATGIETVRGATTINLGGSGFITAPLLDLTTTQLSGGAASTTFNLNGGTLTVGQITQGTNGTTGSAFNFNGGTLVASAASSTFMTGITAANVLGGGAIINTGANAITVGQSLLHGGSGTDGGLTKQGTGALTLTGTNSYNGATTVSAGALNISGSSALIGTSGVSVTSGAALQLQTGITTAAATALTLNGAGVAAAPNGALENVSGANTYTGLITLGSNATIGSDAGTLILSNTSTITGSGFNLTLAGAGNGTLAGIIGTGAGTLTKTGAGIWTLTGSNTYSGSTSISAGALNIQNAGALAGTFGVSVTSGAALQIQGGVITSVAPLLTLNGAGVTASPNGALENVSGVNTYSGLLALGANSTIGSDAGTLTLSNSGTITGLGFALTLTGSGNGTIAGIIGTGAGTLTKTGTGTWILSGGNTYTGTTLISAGALQIGAGASGAANGSLATTGTITDNGALVFDRADTVTQGVDFSSAGIAGTGSLTQLGTGTLVLNVANSYTGSTTISSGTLSLTGAGTLNNGSYAGNIFNSGVFNYNSSSAQTLSGIISNGGSLAKGGVYANTGGAGAGLSNPSVASTLTLTGSDTYSGSTTVSVGTLQLAGASGALIGTTGIAVNGNATLIDGDSTAANNNGTINRINTAAPLTLGGANGGGTYTLAFGSSGAVSQTLASLTVGLGGDTINTANTAAGTSSLIFTGASGAGYIRSTGALLNVANATGFTPSFTNAPTATGGSSVSGAGGNAILTGAILNGSDFVAAGSGVLTAATYTASAPTSLTAGANITLTGGNTTLAGGTTLSINSLKFTDNAARTLNIGTGSALTIASGGILTSSAVATAGSAITSGTITSGQGDLWIYANGSGFTNVRNTSSVLAISSVIADNGSPMALTVGGGQQLALTGVNTYSGGTYLDNGYIIVNADSGLGNTSGTVTAVSGVNAINPGSNSFTFNAARNFVVYAGASLTIGDGSQTDTIAGTVSGGGALESGYVSNGERLILTGNNSGFTGQYVVDGILQANEGAGLSSNANLVFVGRDGSGGAFDLGILETTASSFTRSVGTGADQVQWQNDTQFASGGFAAVGSSTLTVNLGGAGATLTYGAGGFISAVTGFTPSLILGDANSTAGVNFVNALNLNGGLRDFNVGSLAYSGTLSGVLSGNSSSGVVYGATAGYATGYLVLAGSNTYAGSTYVLSGSLGVFSLNHIAAGSLGGSNSPAASSSLGAPTTAANGTIYIGSGAYTGALRYLGTGETTDRVISLAGTTGGATLDQSGSGLLDFASNLTTTGIGAKVLTLQGSTTGTGELDGGIGDSSSGSTSLTKAGTGTWTLTGTSTYSGATTVTGGTLIVSGSLSGTASVGIAGSGSTLGGTGLINASVTGSTGTILAPGLSTNGLSISGASTLNLKIGSTLQLTMNNSNAGTSGSAALTDYSKLTLGSSASATLAGAISTTVGTVNTGDLFTVIIMNGSSPVTGTFSNTTLVAGQTSVYQFNSGGALWYIDYAYNPNTLGLTDSGVSLSTFEADTNGDDVAILASVPEPSTWAMLIAGTGMLIAVRRRRR
jgi:autotransporter-associated beta strand protein